MTSPLRWVDEKFDLLHRGTQLPLAASPTARGSPGTGKSLPFVRLRKHKEFVGETSIHQSRF